jgi:hypothetical protein
MRHRHEHAAGRASEEGDAEGSSREAHRAEAARLMPDEFRIQDSGFRIQDSGFRIQNSEFRMGCE